MPRRPRVNLVGHPQHVVQRGHNREACFFAEEDYRFYLHWLRESAKKYGCARREGTPTNTPLPGQMGLDL